MEMNILTEEDLMLIESRIPELAEKVKIRQDVLTINELVSKAYVMAKSKGFWDKIQLDEGVGASGDAYPVYQEPNIPEKLALIHSEVSEALEAYRDGNLFAVCNEQGKPEGFETELADVVIRLADLCGYLNIDLEKIIVQKMAYNASRPFKHGRVF